MAATVNPDRWNLTAEKCMDVFDAELGKGVVLDVIESKRRRLPVHPLYKAGDKTWTEMTLVIPGIDLPLTAQRCMPLVREAIAKVRNLYMAPPADQINGVSFRITSKYPVRR